MRKPPAFQFYADDFLSGTMHFTDAEVGLFIRLLCVQWTKGGLVDDDNELLSWGRVGSTSVQPSLNRIRAKFQKCDDGFLRNTRLEEERTKQIAFRERQKASGQASAKARLNQASTVVQPSLNQASTGIEPSHNPPSPVSSLQSPSNTPLAPQGGKRVRVRFEPPTRKELDEVASEIGLPREEVDGFVDHFTSNGWRVGANPMKCWQAALRNWNRRRKTDGPRQMNFRPGASQVSEEVRNRVAAGTKNGF